MDIIANRKEGSAVSIRIALVMLFLSGVILVSGYDLLREWSALQTALAAGTAIWVTAGVISAVCSVWLLIRDDDLRPAWCGVATLVAGMTLGIAVFKRIAPCSGPKCALSRLTIAGGLILFGVLAARIATRPAGR